MKCLTSQIACNIYIYVAATLFTVYFDHTIYRLFWQLFIFSLEKNTFFIHLSFAFPSFFLFFLFSVASPFSFHQQQNSFMMKAMLVFAMALLVLVVARAEDSDSENTLDLSRFRLVSPRLLRRGVGVSSFLRSIVRLD